MKTVLQRRVAAGALAAGAAPAAELSRRLRQTLHEALRRASPDTAAPHGPALTLPRARHAVAPALLAAAHPGGAIARETMRALYERCLADYRAALRPDDAAATHDDDVGAAAASFVAANLQALHGAAALPASARERLQAQLTSLIASSRAWAQAAPDERQLCFEKLAILGVLIGESAEQAKALGPIAVENVRRAAQGYLLDFLGVDADALLIGRDGLTVRVSEAAAA